MALFKTIMGKTNNNNGNKYFYYKFGFLNYF